MSALFVAVLFAATGCQTDKATYASAAATAGTNSVSATNQVSDLTLREGDTLKISFPGAPNLDGNHVIRRDGFLGLDLVGDVKAAGKTIAGLRDDLLKAYKGQINSEQITVELLSSSYPVFVTGAVLRPNKVLSDHPMTALEAIMECGGFDYTKANLKAVDVLRQEGGSLIHHKLNLKKVMGGESSEQFYLRPNDIIYVPEKFQWF